MKKKLKSLKALANMSEFAPLTSKQLKSVVGGFAQIDEVQKTDLPAHSGLILNPGQATEVCVKSC